MGPREFYPTIASTQDRALELARAGAASGTRVVAERQTRGRGRSDHAWASPDGGLYLSILLRAPPESVTWLPIALGAQLAESLGREYGLPLAAKWPNDVLLVSKSGGARKLAGILVDRVDDPSRTPVEVVGIGVNVTTDRSGLPEALRARVATLAETAGPPPTRDAVERIVVASAVATADGLRDPERARSIQALCRARLFGIGRAASVDGRPAGTILGLGPSGELLLQQGAERVAIRTGEVRVDGVA